MENPEIDIWYTNFCNFSVKGIRSDKLSLCDFDFLSGATLRDGVATDIPELLERSLRYQPLFNTGMVVRRTFYESLGGFDNNFKNVGAEDWEFTLRAITHGRVAYITKANGFNSESCIERFQ